jgi:biopolymer transport protein ExbD
MARKLATTDEALSDVNVIPLADVSLVLLIVLMVISPMISQTLIRINAAKAQAAQSQQDLASPETPIIVTFQPGALFLNGAAMGSELEFVRRLEAVLSSRRDRSVLLTANPVLTEGKVVHVMDLIKRHRATNLVMLKWDANQTYAAPMETAMAPEAIQ